MEGTTAFGSKRMGSVEDNEIDELVEISSHHFVTWVCSMGES